MIALAAAVLKSHMRYMKLIHLSAETSVASVRTMPFLRAT